MANSTREVILEKALDMFSERGYERTNLRELSEQVGITKSALYKHFDSKEDIWNSTMEYYDSYYLKRAVNRNESMPIPMTIDEFKTRSIQMVEMTINDPMIIKGRKLLTIEQFRNEKTAADATNRLFLMSLNRNKALLAAVMEAGLLKKTDIDMLSLTYTTPISALIQICDRQPDKKEYVLETADKYIDYFISLFGNKKGD